MGQILARHHRSNVLPDLFPQPSTHFAVVPLPPLPQRRELSEATHRRHPFFRQNLQQRSSMSTDFCPFPSLLQLPGGKNPFSLFFVNHSICRIFKSHSSSVSIIVHSTSNNSNDITLFRTPQHHSIPSPPSQHFLPMYLDIKLKTIFRATHLCSESLPFFWTLRQSSSDNPFLESLLEPDRKISADGVGGGCGAQIIVIVISNNDLSQIHLLFYNSFEFTEANKIYFGFDFFLRFSFRNLFVFVLTIIEINSTSHW